MLDTVFVSSTVIDLKLERRCLSQVIKDLGYKAILSEDLETQSLSSEEVCTKWARNCDVYILVLGERYGCIIPEYDISPTELEFQVAKESDSEKILVYVKDIEQREPRQQAFVSRVEDFTGGYFRGNSFHGIDELEQRVRMDLMRLMARKRAKQGYPLFLSKMIIDTSLQQQLLTYYNRLDQQGRQLLHLLYHNPGITEREIMRIQKINQKYVFHVVYPLVQMDMLFAEGQENIFFCIPADRKAYWDALYDTINRIHSAGEKICFLTLEDIFYTYEHYLEND